MIHASGTVVGERAELRFTAGILCKIVSGGEISAVDPHGGADGLIDNIYLNKAAGERPQRVRY